MEYKHYIKIDTRNKELRIDDIGRTVVITKDGKVFDEYMTDKGMLRVLRIFRPVYFKNGKKYLSREWYERDVQECLRVLGWDNDYDREVPLYIQYAYGHNLG